MVEEMDSHLRFQRGVTLLGGGGFTEDQLKESLKLAPELVSADGGANHLASGEYIPKYIIGDCDSVKDVRKWESKGTKIFKIPDQNSTDFDKCLQNINAPKFICIGFASERLDHFLAVCSSLVNYRQPILVMGKRDLIFHLPNRFKIDLPIHSRISLYPLKKINSISSKGLKYSLDGIMFSPTDRIGTSNSSVNNQIEISYSGDGMLVILSSQHLEKVWRLF
tara:strand:+ start:53 stop:718 length:666 start_codon:yes stop_codon:yes gene_type:complete